MEGNNSNSDSKVSAVGDVSHTKQFSYMSYPTAQFNSATIYLEVESDSRG